MKKDNATTGPIPNRLFTRISSLFCAVVKAEFYGMRLIKALDQITRAPRYSRQSHLGERCNIEKPGVI